MALVKADKVELEKMLHRVCLLALWELGVTNGISDDMAWGAAEQLYAWVAPIVAHFESIQGDEKK